MAATKDRVFWTVRNPSGGLVSVHLTHESACEETRRIWREPSYGRLVCTVHLQFGDELKDRERDILNEAI